MMGQWPTAHPNPLLLLPPSVPPNVQTFVAAA
jgi:hypothetical protein